ncbi:hypothetical protein A9977_10460 [Variovorax sp. UMC13]|nr:hypothetical protein [Variovorax sp. UMC13]
MQRSAGRLVAQQLQRRHHCSKRRAQVVIQLFQEIVQRRAGRLRYRAFDLTGPRCSSAVHKQRHDR